MSKVVSFLKAADTSTPERFARFWREQYLDALRSTAPGRDHLTRAVHNHVLAIEVRTDAPASASMWSGIGCYYFDSDDAARDLLAGGDLDRIMATMGESVSDSTHLLCDEKFIFDKNPDVASVKMFAFFKRLPTLTRDEALAYYYKDHAAMANSKRNPIVKYFQNHVSSDYVNPDQRFDYDGGPEAWFVNLETAQAFFGHPRSMEMAAEDEARFVQRDHLNHWYTDEVEVYRRA